MCHTSAAAHERLRRGYSAWPDREPAVGGSKVSENEFRGGRAGETVIAVPVAVFQKNGWLDGMVRSMNGMNG